MLLPENLKLIRHAGLDPVSSSHKTSKSLGLWLSPEWRDKFVIHNILIR